MSTEDTASQDSAPQAAATAEDDLPEQMQIRRAKRQRLLDSGRDAYPVTVPVTHTIEQVRETHGDIESGVMTGALVTVPAESVSSATPESCASRACTRGRVCPSRPWSLWTGWGNSR